MDKIVYTYFIRVRRNFRQISHALRRIPFMKIWQLAYPHNLQHVTAPDLKLTDDKVKVKVTKALLTESDVAVYTGAIKVNAPFIPGRFAIGQVT